MSNTYHTMSTPGFSIRHDLCGHQAVVRVASEGINEAVIFECHACNAVDGHWAGISVHSYTLEPHRANPEPSLIDTAVLLRHATDLLRAIVMHDTTYVLTNLDHIHEAHARLVQSLRT